MMPNDRFERQLPELLTELAGPRTPDYFDDILRQTANSSQRPAWSLPERWLPMVDFARHPVPTARIPWRIVWLGFALLALIVAMVAAQLVGTRESLPAPFGLARAGLVAYANAGDIYTVNPVTGTSTRIVSGPETDTNPRWSRDGTRIAFERLPYAGSVAGLLFVARADGSDVVQLTPEPLLNVTDYAFSPDGKRLLISADFSGMVGGTMGGPVMYIAATDGSEIHMLDVGMAATNAAWRPPNGSDILFMDNGDKSTGFGSIHLVSSQGGDVRTILVSASAASRYRGHPLWSPDGSEIAFGEWVDSSCCLTVQTHVIRADGTGDRILPTPSLAMWQSPESWSNDGTFMLAIRGYTGGPREARPVAAPADGSGLGTEIPYPGGMSTTPTSGWEWAPDDSSILGTPVDDAGAPLSQVLVYPVGGTFAVAPWTTSSNPSWQRR